MAKKYCREIATELESLDSQISNKEYFGGEIFSKRQTSTNTKAAVGTVKLRDIVIQNKDGANAVSLGIDGVDTATMRTTSFQLDAGASLGFVKLDLATLFLASASDGAAAIIHVIGTKE